MKPFSRSLAIIAAVQGILGNNNLTDLNKKIEIGKLPQYRSRRLKV